MDTIFETKDANGSGDTVRLVKLGDTNDFIHLENRGSAGWPRLSADARREMVKALQSTLPAENAIAPKEDGVFRIGDKVRIVDFGGEFNGAVGEIEDIDAYLNVYVTDTSGSVAQHILNDTVPCIATELEHLEEDDVTALADAVLAPAEKVDGVFNIGDRVVLMDDFDNEIPEPALGSLGTVTEVLMFGEYIVEFDSEDGDFTVQAGEIEHNLTDDYSVFLERVEKAGRAYPNNPDLHEALMILVTGLLLDESPEAKAAFRELVVD